MPAPPKRYRHGKIEEKVPGNKKGEHDAPH